MEEEQLNDDGDEVEGPEENLQKNDRKKGKKAPPKRRKSKKEKESSLTKEIRLLVESGKVSFGFRQSLKNAKNGKIKLLIVSNNIPKENLFEIEHYSKSSKIPVHKFDGSSKDLANICGKPFLVSAMCVFEQGESNILNLIKK